MLTLISYQKFPVYRHTTAYIKMTGIVETHLDDTIDKDRLVLKGYDLIKCNQPLNFKRGGVGLYIRESIPKKERPIKMLSINILLK